MLSQSCSERHELSNNYLKRKEIQMKMRNIMIPWKGEYVPMDVARGVRGSAISWLSESLDISGS